MNKKLQAYARNSLKDGLAQCPDKMQMFFKRMYADGDMNKTINDVVDSMPEGKLDWAMQQVKKTLEKLNSA